MHRRTRLMAATVALLCVFTIAAGLAVVRLLPGRLALWQPPQVAARQLAGAPQVLGAAAGTASAGPPISPSGLATALSPITGSGVFGPHLGILVTNLATGRVLYSVDPAAVFAPASTTKLATAIAAVHVLGPAARFRTTVVTGSSPAAIVLVGGGDPTLAAGRPPAADYPQPATLAQLAERTARALRDRGLRTVQLGYDASLYSGPGTAVGWSPSYISSGNVSVITPLEVDQGRLTAAGAPQDADLADALPRSADPAGRAAAVFARFLAADGIPVHGTPVPVTAARGARTLAAVDSPPLAQIVQWMLEESNNVIAENLARHVAIATGHPASFGGGAAATESVLRGLGVTGIQLYDGSGLSVDDRIAPAALVQLVSLAARTAAAADGADRAAGREFFRHAAAGRECVRPGRHCGLGRGAGQDRKPGHGGSSCGHRVRAGRAAARIRDHGGQAARRCTGRRRHRHDEHGDRARSLRLPLTAARLSVTAGHDGTG